MTAYEVQTTVSVLGDRADDRSTSQFVRAILAHVETLGVPVDSALQADNRDCVFWLEVEAVSPTEAAVVANNLLRTAAHVAGGTTADWPNADAIRRTDWGSRLVEHSVEAHPVATGSARHLR